MYTYVYQKPFIKIMHTILDKSRGFGENKWDYITMCK